MSKYIVGVNYLLILVIVKGCLSEDTIQIFLRQLGKYIILYLLKNYIFQLYCVSAGAMYEFNKQGILHRDLKPQNILLKFSGETRYPEPNQITLKIGNWSFLFYLVI